MDIKWSIESLIVNSRLDGQPDVVVSASWRVWAEENGIRGTAHGRVNFPPPTGDKFTAYPNLAESTILQWVWDTAIGDPDIGWSKQIAESQAIKALRAQQAAVTEKPLPWVPPPPPVEPKASLEERVEAAETIIDLLLMEGE